VPNETVVIVSDVHLGAAPEATAAAFHRFLESVPDMARHLVINGDLFDFWFEYRSVIPRRAFPTLNVLHRMRRAGVRITMTGGNHDRWGGPFWHEELGASFHPEGTRLDVAGWRTFLTHGDGLTESLWASAMLHRLTRWPPTIWAFRLLHPDVGYRLVNLMSRSLADRNRDPAVQARAATDQATFAGHYLSANPAVDLLVLGHTHRPALIAFGERRWYLNPGAWVEGMRYAIVTPDGPTLASMA